jgi:hypothetical protein
VAHLYNHHAALKVRNKRQQARQLFFIIVEKQVKRVHPNRAPVRHPQRHKKARKTIEHCHHGKVAGRRLGWRAKRKHRRHLQRPIVRDADGERRQRWRALRSTRRAQLAWIVRAAPYGYRFIEAVNKPVARRQRKRRRSGHLHRNAQQVVVHVGPPLKVATHQHNTAGPVVAGEKRIRDHVHGVRAIGGVQRILKIGVVFVALFRAVLQLVDANQRAVRRRGGRSQQNCCASRHRGCSNRWELA